MTSLLQHTPIWVFALFFILLRVGFMQARTREVSFGRAAILPLAMIGLSLSGVAKSFDTPLAYGSWAVGIAACQLLNRIWRMPRGAYFDSLRQCFVIPGSWLPLGIMLSIFCTKFAVAASLAVHPAIARDTLFAASISLLYGVFSGLYFARAVRLWTLVGKSNTVSISTS